MKYSYVLRIIFRFTRPIDWTLAGITIPGQSGPESIDNEGLLDTLKISRTGALPSDAV